MEPVILQVGGLWTAEKAKEHLNFLEMFAVLFALKSFRTLTHGKHVTVMVDNTTTESTINQMDTSHSLKPNKIYGISALSNIYGLLWLVYQSVKRLRQTKRRVHLGVLNDA